MMYRVELILCHSIDGENVENASFEKLEQYRSMIGVAETILSNSLGKTVRFTSVKRLTGPSGERILFRFSSTSGSEPAGSYIIKKAASIPLSIESLVTWEMRGFFNDWIGTEFLSSLNLDDPVSPIFFGGDINHSFFIMEDLGEHRNLVDPLLHGDATNALNGLLKYSTSLGTLHATTVGKAGVFRDLFSIRLPGQQPFAEELQDLELRMEKVQLLLNQLGVPDNSGLVNEIAMIAYAVSHPDPFLVYIHCDPCPDNLFDLGDRYRWIDFEYSHYGHALLDAIFPRMIWPSCWCANRLPDEVILRMENNYRTELIRGCPEAQENVVWESNLVKMCGFTLLSRLTDDLEIVLEKDRQRGIASVRQRLLAQLEMFIKTSETFNNLPNLRGAASYLYSFFQLRWKETPLLPIYPAFGYTQAGS